MARISDWTDGPRAFFWRLLCRFNRHEPRGFRADWDGTHYISKCEYCNAPIRRMAPGRWLRDTLPRRSKRSRDGA